MTTTIMKGSYGLHTQSDQVRSPYSKESSPFAGELGIVDFAACMNVDISDRFRVSRRRGITRKILLDSHSLWPVENKYCLFVNEGNLNILLPGFTEYETIATVTPGIALSACVVDGIAYWSNGVEKGKVIDSENTPWVMGDVVSNNQTRQFYDPPLGQHIDFHNGQMYVAAGREVWYSDPYGPDVFAMGDNFLAAESTIQMIRHVTGGMYLSDSVVTWFLSGSNPKEFVWKEVDNHPVLPYSDKGAVGAMPDGVWKPGGKIEVAFWLTNEGIMFGDASGQVANISESKIDLVSTYTTGAVLVDGSALVAQFI